MEALLHNLEKKGLKVEVKQIGSERDEFYVKEIRLRNEVGKVVAYADVYYTTESFPWSDEPQKRKISGLSWFVVTDEHRRKGLGTALACLVFLGTGSHSIEFTVLQSESPFWEKILGTGVVKNGEVLLEAEKAKSLGVSLLKKVIPARIWNSPQTRSMKRLTRP